ncbi:amino acid adenylation domain-containing protein [Streptomyces sp. NPDC001274]
MRCVHERFEEQAARTPGATALIHDDERIDYAGLDERAARLAGLLAERGIRPGDTVGVHLERSVALVVTVLGILKAGACYVMLDPAFPAARLAAMAEDSAAVAVVTTRAAASGAPGTDLVHVEDADGARPLPRGAVTVRPDDLACVMFTSGSTGRPKGIASPHRAVTATLTGQTFASFGPGAVWLQCAPLSWDAFAMELWGPLMSGGTCVLHPGARPEPFTMARLVAEHGITSLYLSSSLFNVVVDEYPQVLDGLRELVVGGEALSAPHAARALERHPRLRLSNGYGPVECMVFLTVHPVAPAELGEGPVPIGRPLAGKRVYVLDEELRPAPDGRTGEIYAAGEGLALAYRGRPALTAERFVAAPSGERLYRTGDLGRRRADGVLEYLGRADGQVKIRGFRVEPGEVENVLARHPDVDRAAVVAHEHPSGDRQLTAYVVPRGGDREHFREDVLRAHAREVLAEYLVPAAFVPLDALPLTPSGKLDRAALPEPRSPKAPGPAGPGVRHGSTATVLCTLFSEVLDAGEVGPDDDFFALGGHSLLAARLLGRVRGALGAELDIRTLFEAPTPSLLAPLVDTAPPVSPEDPATSTAVPGALPVSPAQHRLWFLDRIGAGAAYNLPMLVRLRGPVDADALAGALADVAGRHDVLRTLFEECGGAPVRRVLDGDAARPPLRRLRVPGDSMDREIEREARHHFDLRTELPVRATLFTVDEDPDAHALLVLVHHIAGDGWSLRPLFRDLSRAYRARAGGGTSAGLEPLDVPYAEHARRQLARLGPASDPHTLAARQLTYWRKELDGLPAGGPLLPRRPGRPAVPGPRARVVVHRLDAAAHARVVESARARGATLFMALHAALATALLRAGADEDLAIGAPVASRAGDGSVEDAVGFFVNMLVLRTDVSGDPTPAELLARVRETDLAAFGHQDVPFEDVVGELNPPRTPGRQPFTDVVLALQNNARAEVALPGAEHGVEIVRTGAARFELLMDVTDSTSASGEPDGLTLTFEYRDESLEEAFVPWLARALPEALEAQVASPDTPLSRLALTAPPRRAGDADRIPVPERRRTPLAAGRPMTALEQEVAAVWCEVLGVRGVGPDDDFFALGGNSLRAVRAVARLAAGRPVTTAQLFAAPTVSAFAAELERATARPEISTVSPIPRRPRVPRRAPAQDRNQTSRKQQEEWQWTSA